MRFSRFKQQMEGQPCTPRKPRPAVPRQKKTKTKGCPTAEKISHEEQNPKIEGEAGIKAESGGDMEPMQGIEQTIKPEPVAKQEPTVKSEPREQEELVWPTASAIGAVGPDQPSQELASFQATCEDDFSGEETRPASSGGAKQEPIVKSEPLWED